MTIFLRCLGRLLLLGAIAFSPYVRAEDDCSGPFYTESTCGGVCTQDKCQDQSMAQDGSEFQCCPPPPSATPELPGGVGPFALALALLGLLYARNKRRKPNAPPA